jgi:hypothetical protein
MLHGKQKILQLVIYLLTFIGYSVSAQPIFPKLPNDNRIPHELLICTNTVTKSLNEVTPALIIELLQREKLIQTDIVKIKLTEWKKSILDRKEQEQKLRSAISRYESYMYLLGNSIPNIPPIPTLDINHIEEIDTIGLPIVSSFQIPKLPSLQRDWTLLANEAAYQINEIYPRILSAQLAEFRASLELESHKKQRDEVDNIADIVRCVR